VPGDGRGELQAVSFGDQVGGGAEIGLISIDRPVYLLGGYGLGLEDLADCGEGSPSDEPNSRAIRRPAHRAQGSRGG